MRCKNIFVRSRSTDPNPPLRRVTLSVVIVSIWLHNSNAQNIASNRRQAFGSIHFYPAKANLLAPTDLAHSESIPQDVMDGCEHARVRVNVFEDRIAIHEIVEVSSAALLNYRCASILFTPALESSPKLFQPVHIDDVGKDNVSFPIERFRLVRRQRLLCDV